MKKLFLSLILLALVTPFLNAQNILVKGTVKEPTGEPVPGALVLDKSDSKRAALVEVDGSYQINVPANATLEVVCMGYTTQQVPVEGRTVIDIILPVDSQMIEDVIVVAFGTQTKESFTGSATVVKNDVITQRQVSSPIAALNGQVAGLQMVEGNGPSSSPSLVIRGFGSINAGTSPLIVLDGLPYNGYWSDINPQDVENISVLKDAASNALYGARGANGVIMITTKSAKRGQASITFDSKIGVNTDGKRYYDYIDAPATYYEMYYQMLYNYRHNYLGEKYSAARNNALATLSKSSGEGGLTYIVYTVPDGQPLIGEDGKINRNATLGSKITGPDGKQYTLYPDSWRDEGLRNGFRHEYNLNISGGDEKFQFIASLGYLSNEGLTYGSDYQRLTARAKADYQARQWLKIGANMTFTRNTSNNLQNAFAAAYSIAPIFPLYVRDAEGNILTDSHGKVYDYGDGVITGLVRPSYKNDNPLQSDLLDIDRNASNAFGMQGYADIKFLKDFTLTINGSVYDTENRSSYAFNPYYGYYANTGGTLSTSHERTFDVNLQQLLKYHHTFGSSHNVDLLLGHEYNKNTYTYLSATKDQIFAYESITELDGALLKSAIDGNVTEYNTEGFMFRGQYDYMGKYFGSASYRLDGSSAFDPSSCWGSFWSLGGAWIISKEKWFNMPQMDMLKFKASYGVQGNDGIPEHYYERQFNITTVNSEAATTFSSQGNKNITWESNGNFNTGVEAEMFDSRLSLGLDYYYRKTTDMLLWKSVPLGMGYDGYYDNVGDMVNQGVEFSISGTILRTKNLAWSANLNMSHNNNKVTYLPEQKKSTTLDGHGGYLDGNRFVGEGLPLYTWYLKKYAGVDDQGRATWYCEKDGQTITTTNWDNGTKYLCGSPHAKLYGGFGTDFSAYGFNVTVNFLYSLGRLVYDGGYQTLMGVPYDGYTGDNIHKDMLNAWTAENTDTDIPRAQFNDKNVNGASDRFLIDGSCLTLKNINLGYTVPSALLEKAKISSLRVYLSADNIWYWSRRKGLDPRTSLTGSTSGTGYSPMRTISGGVTFKF